LHPVGAASDPTRTRIVMTIYIGGTVFVFAHRIDCPRLRSRDFLGRPFAESQPAH
jgi:hypothetical protein